MSKKIGALFVAVLIVATLYIIGSLVVRTSPLADDGVNAAVAKNLANGIGYCTSFGEIICFDPRVTTGPTLVLPAALAIKIFGNLSWVPGSVTYLATILLLSLFLWLFLGRSEGRLEESKVGRYFQALCLGFAVLLIFLVIGDESSNSGEYVFARGFTKLVGEFPAILMFIIGSWVLRRGKVSSSTELSWGGLFLGLAVLTKFIMALPVAVFLFLTFPSVSDIRSAGFLKIATLAALPLLVFETYKITSLGIFNYFKLKLDEAHFTSQGASGVSGAGHISVILSNLSNNTVTFVKHFGGYSVVLLFVFLYFLTLGRQFLRQKNGKYYFAASIAGFSIVCWWLALSPTGWVRHLFPGIVPIAILLAMMILEQWKSLSSKVKVILVLFLAFYMFQSPPIVQKFKEAYHSPRLAQYEATLDFLEKQPHAKFIGCGMWLSYDLEYGLSKANNFSNCLEKDQKSIDEKEIFLVRSEYWNWEHNPRIDEITSRCEKDLLFENGPFRVSKCVDAFQNFSN